MTNEEQKKVLGKTQPGAKLAIGNGPAAKFIAVFISSSALMIAAIILFVFIVRTDYFVNPAGPGCTGGKDDPVPSQGSNAMKKFASSAELKKFLEENSAGKPGSMMYGIPSMGMSSNVIKRESATDSSGVPTWNEAQAPAGLPKPGADYSTTNVQVAGVDESDIVKTDGEFIYAISGNTVSIAKAYPAESAEIVSKIELDSAPQGMYVNGNKLAVYGQKWNFASEENLNKMLMPINRTSFTFMKVYDIGDKSNPKEERNLYFEGANDSSRMIGDYVYLITSTYPNYIYANLKDESVAPLIIDNGSILNDGGKDIACKGCSRVYYFDMPYNSYTYTTVSAIDLADSGKKVKSEIYLLDQTQNNIYISENNLYITYTKYVSEETLTMDIMMGMIQDYVYPVMSEKDKQIVEEIKNTKNYILSPEEKIQKIGMIIQKYEKELESKRIELEKEFERRVKQKYEDISKELEKTVIHKIAISKGELAYRNFGEVTGAVLNQYSMDEDSGYFRIATTKNRNWSSLSGAQTDSYSNLYVLDENMNFAGKIENIAKGEQIYSVRFMQGRAYMVTFRQMDPLFVIDLKDPRDPKILGELKVPGYSSYLHPYDETTLIGIGKESDENGRVTGGVKLSLFDVADVANPKELDKYVVGDSSSNSLALSDPKAFLFSKDKNLLVIPVTKLNMTPFMKEGISFEQKEMILPKPMPTPVPSPMPPANEKYFNGAYVFSIDKYRFTLRGEIDHADGSISYWQDYNTGVHRSLYIKDMLYTLSNKYLLASSLADLSEVKKIELPQSVEINPMRGIPPVSVPGGGMMRWSE